MADHADGMVANSEQRFREKEKRKLKQNKES
jgi:hypothetical protein